MSRDHIVGYADKISVAPGDTIRFMVSVVGPTSFEADIVKTRCGDLNPQGPGFKEEVVPTAVAGAYPAREQICRSGSYVRIPRSATIDALQSFTVQATIWPTARLSRKQAILAKWDARNRAGFALVIDETGRPALLLGDGAGAMHEIAGAVLELRRWVLLAASYDASSGKVAIRQEPLDRTRPGVSALTTDRQIEPGRFATAAAPFLIAAWTEEEANGDLVVGACFNGKIERPRLANRALDRLEIETARQDRIPTDLRSAMAGFWDFSQDITTTTIRDFSLHRHDGVAVNLPARGMTGSNWTGEEDNWRHASEQYGAIHFHDDDIYDAGWHPDLELTLPDGLKSGLYACRIRAGALEDRIPFFVRPPRGTTTARVAYLASTATYMAYANLNPVPFDIAELLSGRLLVVHDANLLIDEHPEWGPSLYDVHSDGSGVCYSSRLRPILNMRPGYISQFGGQGSSLREFNADTHIIDWLEEQKVEYDVLTDEDLHAEGFDLIRNYGAVLTGSHPEYFSSAMWDATKAYIDDGGRLMVLGGNSFYWRIAYHKDLPGVIEVRRNGPAIRTWETEPGEGVQSFDGARGGLWRTFNRAPQSIGGVGFISEGFDLGTYYRRAPGSFDRRARFIFEGIGDDELIGNFGLQGGGAAGVEIDHVDHKLGTPIHTLVLASSEGHSESYRIVNEEVAIMIPNVTATTNRKIRADMIFFETLKGGAVFNTGSIAWCGSLSHGGYDNNVSRITLNVLNRFLDPTPLEQDLPR